VVYTMMFESMEHAFKEYGHYPYCPNIGKYDDDDEEEEDMVSFAPLYPLRNDKNRYINNLWLLSSENEYEETNMPYEGNFRVRASFCNLNLYDIVVATCYDCIKYIEYKHYYIVRSIDKEDIIPSSSLSISDEFIFFHRTDEEWRGGYILQGVFNGEYLTSYEKTCSAIEKIKEDNNELKGADFINFYYDYFLKIMNR